MKLDLDNYFKLIIWVFDVYLVLFLEYVILRLKKGWIICVIIVKIVHALQKY